MRASSFLGIFLCLGSFLGALTCIIIKIIDSLLLCGPTAPIILTMTFLSGLVLFFIGFLGEYIMSMNARIMNRPLVIEEERINFD
jgi:hypothetical protein